jgi:murein DD-endopeptidase MepM/ murein hydrolase activator NlpD
MTPRKSGRFKRVLFLLAVAGLVVAGIAAFRAGPEPEIALSSDLPGIGKKTRVTARVSEPDRGLVAYRIELVQGESVTPLAERRFDALEPWEFWGERTPGDELTVDVGTETHKELREGPATVRVVAERAPSWLRHPDPATAELALAVQLRPPTLEIVSSQVYVAQGGSEAVVYRVGASAVEHGVQAGDWWFRGYPVPGGGERDRFALFGVPYDLDGPEKIRLVARDAVGNEVRLPFVDRFTRQPLRRETIEVSDPFLERVVPAILSQSPEIRDRGSLLESYLAINRELRAINDARLREIAAGSTEEFLWDQAFLQMQNAQVMSNFADRRTYVYDGRAVDRQDHLGYDLASVRNAEILSAGAGVVAHAGWLGIYGNTVIVDHGYGLLSLYGHLSTVDVENGARVERGQVLGRSGQTGLAGGDHLHFSMLLQGHPVDPKEWWDDHWIHDRLELKLGAALPFRGR